MKLTWMLMIVLLAGCGTQGAGYRGPDPAFTELLKEFVDYGNAVNAKFFIGSLDIQFAQLSYSQTGGAIVGYCDTVNYTVLIDPKYWNEQDYWGRRGVLFHELGHCVLKRAHRADVGTDGLPLSIMNPVVLKGNALNTGSIDGYMLELFMVGRNTL